MSLVRETSWDALRVSPYGKVKAAGLSVGENCVVVTAKVSASPRELRHSNDLQNCSEFR